MLSLASLVVCAMAVTAANLVPNPSFSRGVVDPEGWSLNRTAGNQAVWMCDRTDKNHCAVDLIGCGSDWAGVTAPHVPAKPGETFTVAAWLRTEGIAAGQGHLYVEFWHGGSFVSQTGPVAAPNSPMWTLCAGTVTVPEGATSVCASFQLWSRGKVLVGAMGLFRGDVLARAMELLPRPAAMTPVAVTSPRGLPADENHNGLADSLEKWLGVPAGAKSVRLTRRATTCFQTPTPYRPDNDLKTDAVLVYTDDRRAIHSWQALGYRAFFMTGFRDGPGYVKAHPDSPQEAKGGNPLTCGPGSYYMVPTADRRKVLEDRFRTAFENGAEAAVPEEPEYIGAGGYSPDFKKEFEEYYGRPWVAPDSSPQARVDCDRLMGKLEIELLRACYTGARSVKPDAPCFLAAHSPLNYASWDIVFPHAEALRSLPITDLIAQVWTGTARTPINYEGLRRERTFENAYLEYSSSLNLVRGLDIPVWLLMDPLEDNPDRTMKDYFYNYKRTLGAALMFPETDRYEVMPWPTRIFGRVPDPFATTICTIVNALEDMQNHREAKIDAGTPGIASFISDTAVWERSAPDPADFDAVYGLTLPLLMHGVPVQLAQLDRAAEKGYLSPYRVLLVSFDAMKPEHRDICDALAAWTRAGGQLLVFGGRDPYNNLDLWWKKDGFASPMAYLIHALGLNPSAVAQPDRQAAEAHFTTAARTDYTGRTLENRGLVTLDLTKAAAKTGAVFLKLGDSIKSDGWGAFLFSLRLIGTRDGKPVDETIKPGTPQEAALIYSDTGSGLNTSGRFVDGHNELIYALRFDAGKPLKAVLDIGNQYVVSVAPAPADVTTTMEPAAGSAFGKALGPVETAGSVSVLAYPDLGGEAALKTPAGTVVSEAKVGRGGVIVCGLPAAYFAKSPAGATMLRTLVRRAVHAAGLDWHEQDHIGIERGPYEVVKTFAGPTEVAGPRIDLMSSDLALRPTGKLGPDDLLILKRLPEQRGEAPVVAASSATILWSEAEGPELRLIAAGPSGVKGVMRLVTGGKRLVVTARDAEGDARPVTVEDQGDTALLRFDEEPMGLGLRIRAEG